MNGQSCRQGSRAAAVCTGRVAAVSTGAIVLSCVGQNSVLGAFLEQQSRSLGVSELHFCGLLALATLLAAGGMQALKGPVSRWSTGRLALVTGVASAVALLLWGLLMVAESHLSPLSTLPLLVLSLTGIRLFLRGTFKIVSVSVVNENVEGRQRSLVMAMSSVAAGVVFAGMPLGTHVLLERLGFVTAVVVFAVGSIAAGAAVQIVATSGTKREATSSENIANGLRVAEDGGRGQRLDEAKRSRLFWGYSLGLPLNTLIQSSASLMLLPIARAASVDPGRVYAIYLPAMVIGLPCVFFATRNMRHHREIFVLHQASLLISTLGFLTIETDAGWAAAGLGFGAAAGLYTAMASNLWPTAYGLRHAKAYYGFATTIDLCASAAGPLLFGVIHQCFGVQAALWGVLPLPLLAIVLVLSSARGQRSARRSTHARTWSSRISMGTGPTRRTSRWKATRSNSGPSSASA